MKTPVPFRIVMEVTEVPSLHEIGAETGSTISLLALWLKQRVSTG